MKICRGCEESLPLSEFPIRKDRSGKLRPYCRTCVNDITRSRYDRHRRDSPFKLKCTRAKARSKSLNVPFDLTPEYLESIWTGICPVSKQEIFLHERDRSDEYAAELDRFKPELGYVKGNVHFLSRRVNRLKNNVTTKELEELLEWMRIYENK